MPRATHLRINDAGAGNESTKRVGFILGRRASLVVSVAVAAHTLWTSAAPALTYRLYAEEWHLSHTVTTGIFAVYPIAVVATLIAFGGVSDQIGRRAAMLLGLCASLGGALLFAVAPDVGWVFVGRILSGVGVGLSAGPSTAAILEFGGDQEPKRAASLTMTAQAGGFAGALLVGGALTEYGPWPTRLCFWVLAALILLLLVATWGLPRKVIAREKSSWRPQLPFVPKDLRRDFARAAAAIMTAYTFGVLVLSLGGQVEHDLIGSSNALLNGAVLALFPIVLAPLGTVAKALSARIALSLGALASVSGMGLLALAVHRHDLLIYLAATATAGAGYSLLFVGGLQLISASVPPRHRSGVLSALYLLAYLSIAVVAVALGMVATARGLAVAVDLGAVVITIMSIITFVFAIIPRTTGSGG
jgi:predicted MFS family arabinose efflux permease